MLIGYMRVSKNDGSQSLDLQRDALTAAGAERIYEDQASGKRDDRPGLHNCLLALRRGDTLIVWKLDRLGRSLKHLVETVNDLESKGVAFKTLTGAPIDTATPAGKLVLAIFAALAEFERDLLIERTNAGLDAARKRGRVGGRPREMTKAKLRLAMASMGQAETVVSALCEELGISRQTLYRHIGPDGTLRDEGKRLLAA